MATEKVFKPGECNKYVTAIIDPLVPYQSQIQSSLTALHFQSKIESQPHSATISWTRKPSALPFQPSIEENQVLFFLQADDFVNSIKTRTLLDRIRLIQTRFNPGKVVTLIVCGLRAHCKEHPGCITRIQTEYVLTEVQLVANCCHRLLETPEDMATVVCQFSKAIAEAPFKQQQAAKFEQEQVFLGNDSKDCVAVRDDIGLARLWQQQLIKIPQVTLEVAEAITAVYPMPRHLIEAFNSELLLADLPVRRGGVVAGGKSRRIGPELSRRIYKVFTEEKEKNGKE